MKQPRSSLKPALASLALAALAAAGPACAAPSTLIGQVVHVEDGDTVLLLTPDKVQLKVRLASIDAPETAHTNKEHGRIGQPFARNAREHLAELVHGRQVTAHCYEADRYAKSAT